MCQMSGQQVSLNGAIPLSCPPVWVCLRRRVYSCSSCQQRASFRLCLLHSMTSAEPSHRQQQTHRVKRRVPHTHTHAQAPTKKNTNNCRLSHKIPIRGSREAWIEHGYRLYFFESWDDYKKLLPPLAALPPSHLLYFSPLCSPKCLQVEESVLETRLGCYRLTLALKQKKTSFTQTKAFLLWAISTGDRVNYIFK